jgi:4-amino-4-deoxy-L-arabinose transferase-like glycosyltransferase
MERNLLNKSWQHVVFIILLGVVLYCYNINGWDLWNPDEPRYAQVAKEMVETGSWILPHLNGDIYHEKPPLVFWLVALSFKLFGNFTELAARFPIVLLSILVLIFNYFLGKTLFNPLTGFLSSLILATNIEYFWLSRRLALDIPITLFILLALASFYKGYQKEKGRRWYYLSFFLLIGLATLAKGPVGFILPLLIIIIYLALKGELKRLKEMKFGIGALVFLLTLLVWLIPAALQGGKDYSQEIIFHQTVNRFFDTWSHRQPFYYYFEVFPAGFLTWSIFLPAAFIWCFQGWRKKREGDYLLPLVWFIVVFSFFSFSTGKRELYILPLYPAAALIAGKFWADSIAKQEGRFLKLLMNISLSIFVFIVMAFDIFLYFFRSKFYKFLGLLPNFNLPNFLTLSIVMAVLILVLINKKKVCFLLILLMMSSAMIYAAGSIFPWFNQFKSAKPLSQEIVSLMRPGDELIIYKKEPSAFNFYTGIYPIREVKARENLSHMLQSDKRIFCLIAKRDYERLKGFIKEVHILRQANIGHREFVLLSNSRNL